VSRVFVSEATGAAIYVFADDHCPPHIHARHRGEGWVARVRFSFVDDRVKLIGIAPLKNVPRQRVVNALLDDIQTRLAACREHWWIMTRTTCLANRWAIVPVAEAIELRSERRPNTKRIANATFDPSIGRLFVTFEDGTTAQSTTPP